MASVVASSGQSSNVVIPTTIVEVYCTDKLLQVLGWTPEHLHSIRNNTPAGWDSRRAGDGRQICRYSGSLMDGRGILRGIAQGSLTAMCKFGLPDSYVRKQLQGNVYADAVDEKSDAVISALSMISEILPYNVLLISVLSGLEI